MVMGRAYGSWYEKHILDKSEEWTDKEQEDIQF